MPSGYAIMDAFQSGNILQLIGRSNGFPLMIQRANLSGNGSFVKTDSMFKVVIPSGKPPGIVQFSNVSSPGLHIAIKGKKVIGNNSGDKHSHFIVRALPDNYVTFESAEHTGQYLCLAKNGSPGDPRTVGPTDGDAQFFVRIEQQKHQYSAQIQTPFGRPSIANQLRDNCILQLYLKTTNVYLAIDRHGNVTNTSNGNDSTTFFILKDRGMGNYSLLSKQFPGYCLRTVNFTLQGKGDPNMAADYRLKEMGDGRVIFESVICQGAFIGIGIGGGRVETALNLFMVTVQNFGGTETTTKQPLN